MKDKKEMVYIRLLPKGCEKLVTEVLTGSFLPYPKICIGLIKLLLLMGTKNCMGGLEGVKGLGNQPQPPEHQGAALGQGAHPV